MLLVLSYLVINLSTGLSLVLSYRYKRPKNLYHYQTHMVHIYYRNILFLAASRKKETTSACEVIFKYVPPIIFLLKTMYQLQI